MSGGSTAERRRCVCWREDRAPSTYCHRRRAGINAPTGAIFTVDELLDPQGQLSVEHVPPRALAGHELALTCTPCNNASGTSFDADAAEQAKLRAFLRGESGAKVRSFYAVGGTTTRVDAYLGGSLVLGLPGQNDPAETKRRDEYLEQLVASGTPDFHFSIRPIRQPSDGHAHVSWVRTGYLAAFALFGYSYALREEFDPVRAQLADPSTLILAPLVLYDPDGDENSREIRIIEHPLHHRSVVIVWGGHQVFLPHPDDRRTLVDLSRSLMGSSTGRVSYSLQAKVLPWPTEPRHLLDPAAEV